MSKVHLHPSAQKIPDDAGLPPSQEVIDILTEKLEAARRGTLRAVGIVSVYGDGTCSTGWGGDRRFGWFTSLMAGAGDLLWRIGDARNAASRERAHGE